MSARTVSCSIVLALVGGLAVVGCSESSRTRLLVSTPPGLRFDVQPPPQAPAGSALAAVRVTIVDGDGRLVTSASAPVTVSLQSSRGVQLGGTVTVTPRAGVAEFLDLEVDRASPSNVLVATAAGALPATSQPFEVTAGPAVGLRLLTSPGPTHVGAALSPVSVEAVDANGDRAATSAGVTVSLVTPGGATLAGTTTVALVDGAATFHDLSVDLAGTYQLAFASPGLAGDTSAPFAVDPHGQLAFTAQPATPVEAGAPLGPITVELRDLGGARLTGAKAVVTLTLDPDAGPGALRGTLDAVAVNGVATFPDLRLLVPGVDYRFEATVQGFTSATSSSFTVDPLAFTRQSLPVSFPTGPLATGDLDADGREDVAVTRLEAGGDASDLYLRMHLVGGAASAEHDLDQGSGVLRRTGSVAISQTLGGALVIVGDRDGPYLAAGLPTGSFSPVDLSLLGVDADGLGSAHAADVLSVGQPQLVFARQSNPGFTVLDATTLSVTHHLHPPLVPARRLEIGDLDGDGDLDLVAVDLVSAALFVIEQTAPGGTFSTTSVTVPRPAVRADLVDLDGDGDLDALVLLDDGSYVTLANDGQGALADLRPLSPAPAFHFMARAGVGDLNGDGLPDLVLPDVPAKALDVHLGAGGGRFVFAQRLDGLPGAVQAAVVDADGDGQPDVVLTTGEASLELLVR